MRECQDQACLIRCEVVEYHAIVYALDGDSRGSTGG